MDYFRMTQCSAMQLGALRHWAATLLLSCLGCDRSTLLATSRPHKDAGANAASDAGEVAPDAGLPIAWDGGVAYCGAHICACSNGIDDDGDGLADGWDSECTGPFDDDEGSFATGLEKPGNRQCIDCFFDSNAGSGDDDCRIAARCVVDGTSDGAPGACNTCSPSSRCVDNCLRRTPNGCDCFGCCVVELEGESTAVQLAATCSIEQVADEAKCPRCIPSTACFNPCDTCEVCTGKPLSELPASCEDAGGYVCQGNAARCDATAPCATGEYCRQGCCVSVVY